MQGVRKCWFHRKLIAEWLCFMLSNILPGILINLCLRICWNIVYMFFHTAMCVKQIVVGKHLCDPAIFNHVFVISGLHSCNLICLQNVSLWFYCRWLHILHLHFSAISWVNVLGAGIRFLKCQNWALWSWELLLLFGGHTSILWKPLQG